MVKSPFCGADEARARASAGDSRHPRYPLPLKAAAPSGGGFRSFETSTKQETESSLIAKLRFCGVNGKVDAIILTGGIAYSKPWMAMIEERVGWIAPVKIYKGENEMLALAICGKEVLDGVQVKEYK